MSEAGSTLDPGAAGRCAFRTVLDHDAQVPPTRRGPPDDESIRRRTDAAGRHRRATALALLATHGDRALDAGRDVARTLAALEDRTLVVIVDPALPADHERRRHGAPSLLVAAPGAGRATWRAVDVHNHFLMTDGTTPLRCATIEAPMLEDAATRAGRLRKGGAWREDLLRLAHHQRRLESLGVASVERPFVGVVDRGSDLWWLPLDEALDDRGTALAQYDARFAERVALLEAIEARNRAPDLDRPGAPWWHRECETCPHAERCHGELSAVDDVSLVRFTDATDQA
ncbi:MAG TPA: hypothetical protein VKT18_05365, partial [Acidimicrobiales bacterium]|nr:hypothetical protein [Acidimicrobiales bacterium]